MKRLAVLMMLLSLGLFAAGCGGDKKKENKENGGETKQNGDGETKEPVDKRNPDGSGEG